MNLCGMVGTSDLGWDIVRSLRPQESHDKRFCGIDVARRARDGHNRRGFGAVIANVDRCVGLAPDVCDSTATLPNELANKRGRNAHNAKHRARC